MRFVCIVERSGNMIDFNEIWDNDGFLSSCSRDDAEHFYNAGQQSKIDELQRKIAFQEKAIKNIKLQFENKQIDCDRSDRKIDELQARVDEALKLVQKDCIEYGVSDFLEKAMDILKGNKDEN